MADSFEDFADLEDLEDFPDSSSEPRPGQRRGSGLILNIFSGCLVAATVLVGVLFATIFINPRSSYNPFPPPTIPILVLTDTPTPTPKGLLPSTWTPTVSPTFTDTPTETPTGTPTPIPPTETVDPDTLPSPDLESGASFIVQEGSPEYTANDYKPEEGCDWFGVIGQLFDKDGDPVNLISVEAGGSLGETEISQIVLSGVASGVGEGGYEIYLGDQPVDSEGEVWIQLLPQTDPTLPLSEKIFFDTFDDCERNLIRINFVEQSSE